MLIGTACNKDRGLSGDSLTQSGNIAALREAGLDTLWLRDFQEELADACADYSTPVNYTPNEAAYGIEALINLASPTRWGAGEHVQMRMVISKNWADGAKAMCELYQEAYQFFKDAYYATDTLDTDPVALVLRVDSTSATQVFFEATAIFSVMNACKQRHVNASGSSVPCDAFPHTAAFRLGGGDEELSLLPVYFNNAPCEVPCGDTPGCEPAGITAFEEIEARINTNYTPPMPPLLKVFCGFTNMKKVDVTGEHFEDFLLDKQCYGAIGRQLEDCWQAPVLNCVYCNVYSAIAQREFPFAYPTGMYFASINMAGDVCFCGQSDPCKYTVRLIAEFYVGVPVFKYNVKPDKWLDPLSYTIIGD